MLQDDSIRRLQGKETFDGTRCLLFGTILEDFSEQDERNQNSTGLKVEIRHHRVNHHFGNGIEIGCGRSKYDQDVHVGTPAPKTFIGTDIEGGTDDELDRRR